MRRHEQLDARARGEALSAAWRALASLQQACRALVAQGERT